VVVREGEFIGGREEKKKGKERIMKRGKEK